MKKVLGILLVILSVNGFANALDLHSMDDQLQTIKDPTKRLEMSQRYNESYRNYLNSIKGNPDRVFSFGESFFVRGKYEKARDIFSKDVTRIKNLFGAATTSRFLGDNDLAVDYYSEILDRAPNFYEAHLGRGISYRNLKKYEKALADFQYCLHSKESEESYVALGDLYMIMGRIAEAKRTLEAGRAKFPNSSRIKELLVTVYSKGS